MVPFGAGDNADIPDGKPDFAYALSPGEEVLPGCPQHLSEKLTSWNTASGDRVTIAETCNFRLLAQQ